MASINIYVTDELKERMSRVEANWSEVCRRAIEVELNQVAAESGALLSAATQPSETENWQQIIFDQPTSETSIVIKPSITPQYAGVTPLEVMMLSSWFSGIRQQIGQVNMNGVRFSELLQGTYATSLLLPGQPWCSGQLKVEQQLIFKHPPVDQ